MLRSWVRCANLLAWRMNWIRKACFGGLTKQSVRLLRLRPPYPALLGSATRGKSISILRDLCGTKRPPSASVGMNNVGFHTENGLLVGLESTAIADTYYWMDWSEPISLFLMTSRVARAMKPRDVFRAILSSPRTSI